MKRTRTPLFAAVSGLALAVGLALCPPGGSAFAADQRYSTWTDPDAARQAESKAQGLIDELHKLIGEAEKARAADPQFLRDLRDLVRKYDNPWQVRLFVDAFTDGDYTQAPAWTVVSGRWWVEKGYGLRSEAQAAAQQPAEPEKKLSDKEAARQLFGAILNQALGSKGGSQTGSQQQAAAPTGPAVIALPEALTNAFQLTVELTSWQPEGSFAIGPYQGSNRGAGYRLVYRPGANPGLELVRFSSRGEGIIDSVRLSAGLEDRKTHVIEWTRDINGAMAVMLDGNKVLQATDRAFRDPFDGLALTSRGGDVMLARVEAFGAR